MTLPIILSIGIVLALLALAYAAGRNRSDHEGYVRGWREAGANYRPQIEQLSDDVWERDEEIRRLGRYAWDLEQEAAKHKTRADELEGAAKVERQTDGRAA